MWLKKYRMENRYENCFEIIVKQTSFLLHADPQDSHILAVATTKSPKFLSKS